MGIGLGIVLLVIGLVLVTGAINLGALDDFIVEPEALGWIFIIVGIIAIGLSLVLNRQRTKTTHVEERRYDR